jgi:hypothetical protein
MTKNLQLALLRKYIRASSYFSRFCRLSSPQYVDSIVDTRRRLYQPYATQHAGALQPCYCRLAQGYSGTARTSRRAQIARHAATHFRSRSAVKKAVFGPLYFPFALDLTQDVIIFTTMTVDLDPY